MSKPETFFPQWVMDDSSVQNQAWPSTHWSVVTNAGHGGSVEKREALEALIVRYLPVLKWHLLVRRHISRAQIDDLLQEFVLSKVLEQEIIQRAEKKRGRFRSFLATAIDRFVLNHLRDQTAQKRHPKLRARIGQAPEPIDPREMPEDAFDMAWARQLLGQAFRKMRKECAKNQRPDIWDVFKCRVVDPSLRQSSASSYAELVKRHRFISPSQATNVLVTANRMFIRVTRGLIAAYEKRESDIDEEIADLFRIVSRARNQRKAGNYHCE